MHVRRVLLVRLPLALLALAVLLAVAGSVRDWHVVTVTRTTGADPEVMWEQWADVEARPRWDTGLEAIEGDFVEGGRGTVTVEGQGEVDWEIVELTEGESYTDRFSSLAWTHTDWHHEIEPNDDGTHDVTWRLEARGPLALASLPVLKGIFGEEIPAAVDEFVALAESGSPG